MRYKQLFSPEEWTLLLNSVFSTILSYISIDGKIDKGKLLSIAALSNEIVHIRNPLLQEVLLTENKNPVKAIQMTESSLDNLEEKLSNLSELLLFKIDEAFTLDFKKSLLSILFFLIFFNWPDKAPQTLNGDQKVLLSEIIKYLKISVDDLKKQPDIKFIFSNYESVLLKIYDKYSD